MMNRLLVVALMLGSTSSVFAGEDDTVQRGLEYVRKAGENWIEKRGCVSCHQIPQMIWAHRSALSTGDQPSRKRLERWTKWSTNVVNFVKPAQKSDCDREATMAGNIDTMAALLLAIPDNGHSEGGDAAWRKRFAEKLASEQADNGSWKACGQLPAQRRGADETQAATTLWTSYALILHGQEFNRDAAIKFADLVVDPVSTEWWSVRLLVASASDGSDATEFRQRLLSLQNSDGGWGWKTGQPSDALGTGYALYALAQTASTAAPEVTAAMKSARRYLQTTQTDNGRWIVPGTKKSAKGNPTSTANDWGTAWAVIALAEST